MISNIINGTFIFQRAHEVYYDIIIGTKLSDFVIAILGALIGFGLALVLDNLRKASDLRETRKEMLKSMISELEGFQKMIEPGSRAATLTWDSINRKFIERDVNISMPAFQAAIGSGIFNHLHIELQKDVGLIFLVIETCGKIRESARLLYTTPLFVSRYHRAILNREATKICATYNENITVLRSGAPGKLSLKISVMIERLEKAVEYQSWYNEHKNSLMWKIFRIDPEYLEYRPLV